MSEKIEGKGKTMETRESRITQFILNNCLHLLEEEALRRTESLLPNEQEIIAEYCFSEPTRIDVKISKIGEKEKIILEKLANEMIKGDKISAVVEFVGVEESENFCVRFRLASLKK
jgi:hypothetical protein